MPTNLKENGDYPFEEVDCTSNSDLITDLCRSFNKRWLERYSLIPPLDKMDARQRDELKSFAWAVFSDVLEDFEDNEPDIQVMANAAYSDGITDANNANDKKIVFLREELQKLLDRFSVS